jgi:hypothetical protein
MTNILIMIGVNIICILIYDSYLVDKLNNTLEKEFEKVKGDVKIHESKLKRLRRWQVNVINNYLVKIK